MLTAHDAARLVFLGQRAFWGRARPMTVERCRTRIMFLGRIDPADEIVEIRPVTADILWVFTATSASEANRECFSARNNTKRDVCPGIKSKQRQTSSREHADMLVHCARYGFRCKPLPASWQPCPGSAKKGVSASCRVRGPEREHRPCMRRISHMDPAVWLLEPMERRIHRSSM